MIALLWSAAIVLSYCVLGAATCALFDALGLFKKHPELVGSSFWAWPVFLAIFIGWYTVAIPVILFKKLFRI